MFLCLLCQILYMLLTFSFAGFLDIYKFVNYNVTYYNVFPVYCVLIGQFGVTMVN